MLWFCLLLSLRLARSQTANETKQVANMIGNPCTDKNHLFLAPGVLTAGGMNRACVSRFYTDGPATLLITLLTEDRQTTTATSVLSDDGGCLDMNVPSLPNTKADMVVNIRYPDAQCVWERQMPVRISSGRVVVLSSERARYRPGELLRLRVLALRQDLAPSKKLVEEVWLEGPRGAWEGSRVTQWKRVRTRFGLAQLQYQLDEHAPSGKWTVRARMADGSQGSSSFLVGDYELPPFQLSVRHAPKVLRTSDRLVWQVCVRYPWSEAVEGMLVIRLRGAGGGGGGGIRTAVQLRAPRACHRHAAAAKRIGLDGADPPDVVIADFSFQEDGTRIWQNTTVVSQVVDKPISLEFLTKYRAVISPGLPYKLKVKATRWDDKPGSNELVRVCRYPSTQVTALAQTTTKPRDSMCAEGATDASGVAVVLFAAGDDAAPFYRFEAHLSNDTTTSAPPLLLPVRRPTAVVAALGALKPDGQTRTFVPLYLTTNNTSKPYTVHFVVITRGGVIFRWAVTTQCLTSNSGPPHTTPKNGQCNDNYFRRDVIMAQNKVLKKFRDSNPRMGVPNLLETRRKQDPKFQEIQDLQSTGSHDVLLAERHTSSINASAEVSDALLDRHQLRVMLPIRVSHQMCPDSHLIAYFYHEGELVSASKHFDKDDCFANKVEATWLTRQAQPGSKVSLQISTPGPALCGLTVLDTAAKWTEAPVSAKEQLMTSLRRLIDSHRNLTEYDQAGICYMNSDSVYIPSTSFELMASWMAAAGVRLLGGEAQTTSRNCIPHPPALLVADGTTVPRSDFSEAWLWRLLSIGANGTGVAVANAPDSITRYEASAICVARNGVSISAPAVLQVFREFFIHFDSPKPMRRGDSTYIRYRIFNYLYEPLSVQIQILTDTHVEGPKDLVESACVRARASIARRVEIRARLSGQAKIRIRAKAVSDGNCGNVTSARTGVSDEVIIRIAVDPEGVPIREQKSIFLCANSSTESSKSEVLWNWPAVKAVPGTETLTVWAVGDVTGPLLADADSLLTMPLGCGEQNMAQLATNLLALSQLEPTSIAAITAKENVARGFTRQLQYVHPSGGFSAFGSSDATSSTWLTAFVVKHLRRAHKLIWPNLQVPPAIIRAERWLLNQQMENGCFRNEGWVFHRELRGGLNDEIEISSVALTAYVITSLIESSTPLPHRVIPNTLSCFRAFPPLKTKTPTRVYAQALLSYAYMKLLDYEEELKSTNEASLRRSVEGLEENEGVRQVLELLKLAKRSRDYVWWEANSLSSSIEATSYALLALRRAPRALSPCARTDGPAAARWLHAHRARQGGFVSTQDTLVALEALSAWSQGSETNLSVTARSGSTVHRVTLQPGVKIPDVMEMKPEEFLSVSVDGTGCALVQATRAYNTLEDTSAPRDKQLSVKVSVHTDGPFDCDNNGTYCFCAAVIEACVMWTGSFPEMALLEVTLPGGFGADAKLLYGQLQKTTLLLRRIELTHSSNRATFYLGSRDGSDTNGHVGHQCYSIHATGPKVKTRPAYAKVQDYYAPSINDTQVYTISEECPPRIVEDTNDYLSQDNLFAKARASDSGDLVISHDFTFDDIPEGLPLDDPLMFDHIENDNYRASSERLKEIGRLEKPQNSKIFGPGVEHNTFDDKEPEHTCIPEDADQHQTLSDNAVFGVTKLTDTSVSKGTEKGNNYSIVIAGVAVENNQKNKSIPSHEVESDVIMHLIKIGTEKDQSYIDFDAITNNSADKNGNNNGKYKDKIGITDKTVTVQSQFNDDVTENNTTIGDIQEDLRNLKHFVEGNIDPKMNTVTENSSYLNTADYVNVKTNEDSVTDHINQKNDIRPNESISHLSNVVAGNKKVSEPTLTKDHISYFYNIATENAMSEINRQNLYNIISENKKGEPKTDALQSNKHETKYDTRNLLKKIDCLNKVADQQLNATQSRFNGHQIGYKLTYTHDDDDKALTINNNNQNSENNNYKEESKIQENHVKRSRIEYVTPKPELSEKIISNYNTVLETGNDAGVDNPNLADFHVIHTEKDLEVPEGVEGPIPESVLPPLGFVPPAQLASNEKSLNYKQRPSEDDRPFSEEVLAPPPFVVPPKPHGQFKMQSLPREDDFAHRPSEEESPNMYDGLPPSITFPAPPPYDYRELQETYPLYPGYPPTTERAFATILPPKHYAPASDLRSLQSVYTPNDNNILADSKTDALQSNKDESKYDKRNVIKNIDSINKVADQQLNATQSRFNGHRIGYKLMNTHDDDDKALTINNNNQNSENNHYKKESKIQENHVKRSRNENVTPKPELSEKIISNYNTVLETGNDAGVDNANFANFHVIDTEKDLEVPQGVEGPIPESVLPPLGFVPPAQLASVEKSLNYKQRPSEDDRPISEEVLAPPPFVVPPKPHGQFKMQSLPREDDFAHRPSQDESPNMYDGLPPSIIFPAPPPYDYRELQDTYSLYPGYPPTTERAFATILPPKHYAPASDLRSLQSVYTPYGQYFYFKTEEHDPNRKLFVPMG